MRIYYLVLTKLMKILTKLHLKEILIKKHEKDAKKEKIKGQIPLAPIFGFCKRFMKFTQNLGFH